MNATVTMIMSALHHNNIQEMITKHKRDVNLTAQLPRRTSWVILMPAVL